MLKNRTEKKNPTNFETHNFELEPNVYCIVKLQALSCTIIQSQILYPLTLSSNSRCTDDATELLEFSRNELNSGK